MKSYVSQAECKHPDCCSGSRASGCWAISSSNAALQGGWRGQPRWRSDRCLRQIRHRVAFNYIGFSQNVKVWESLLT